MNRIIALSLLILLILSCTPAAYAAEDSCEFCFELSVDGSNHKEVQPGDSITVVLTLARTDKDESYKMYAMQNEICYDTRFFRLAEDSITLSDGISAAVMEQQNECCKIYMNYLSLSGGEIWNARRIVGSFQLEAIAASELSEITNQNYLVSEADGKGVYAATSRDAAITLTSECTVDFCSNGGSSIPGMKVQFGELISRPDDPVRDGFRMAGWYTDEGLQIPWDFDADTVQRSMTLYAKWKQEHPTEIEEVEEDDDDSFPVLIFLTGLGFGSMLGLAALLVLGKKTVKFETSCRLKIKDQKVKKGSLADRPEQPRRPGRTFAGWYADEGRTERWDFDTDTVEDNMTLYAKWL